MFETFGRSFQLVKESFNVLRRDKEIMLFPILSGVVSVLLFASFIIPIFLVSSIGTFSGVGYIAIFLYYLLSYFIVIFFNVGLVTCANIRINGGDPTFKDGFNNALKHVHKIFLWALISATIGLILRAISQRSGWLGRIVVGLIGMAWSLLTFFVIPVMIFENVSVIESIKKSGSLFKKTWGENVVGQFSMGVVFVFLSLPGILLAALGFISGSFSLILILGGFTILYWIILGIISSSLNGIFTTALYNYATKGTIPHGFSEEIMKNVYRQKTGGVGSSNIPGGFV